jgi:hypothetical protein
MKKMKRALRLMRMTCNLCHYLMWICECGKIQKDSVLVGYWFVIMQRV